MYMLRHDAVNSIPLRRIISAGTRLVRENETLLLQSKGVY